MDILFSLGAAALAVLATVVLCWNIKKADQRPSRMTWIIWTILTIITAAGMYESRTLTWQMVTIVLCDVIIVLFCIRRGTGGWTRVDQLTLLACAIIAVLWQLSGDPFVAISLSLLAAVAASVPMFVNLYKDPTIEKSLPYWLMFASTIAQLTALLLSPKPLVIAGWLQPVVYMMVQIIILQLLLRGWFVRNLRLPA